MFRYATRTGSQLNPGRGSVTGHGSPTGQHELRQPTQDPAPLAAKLNPNARSDRFGPLLSCESLPRNRFATEADQRPDQFVMDIGAGNDALRVVPH